jgi:lysophospholipase L1-like esterase
MVTRGRFRLLVLGDSIAYGTGARLLEDTIGRRLVRSLEREGYDAILDVLAVPGATTRDLAAQVRRAASLGADLALIVVGANDLTG